MHKKIKSLLLIALMLTACICSMTSAFAQGEKISVNGIEASAGDVITYSVSFESVEGKVAALNAKIDYDESILSLISGDDENSAIVFGKELDGGVIYNEVRHDEFLFNAANSTQGYDFNSNKLVISLSFLVNETSEKETQINFEFVEIFNLKDLDLIENTTYKLDKKTEVNVYTGDKKLVDKSKPSINQGESNVSVVDKNTNQSSQGSSPSNTTLITIIAIVIVIVLIVTILVVTKESEKKKQNKNKDQ